MKLISKFRSVHTGSIISYANREHSSGKLYSVIGFRCVSASNPNYQWMKGKTVLKRYQTQKHKLQSLLGESFDPSKTETLNMFNNGYRRIWDCGNLVYELV
jgi:cephalosporin hydroxylase